jgi:hypothetical protein
VVLRLAPWRARSVARVQQEWSSVSRIFHHPTRPHLDELDLSRTLELAAAVLGAGDEPNVRSNQNFRLATSVNSSPKLLFIRGGDRFENFLPLRTLSASNSKPARNRNNERAAPR